MVKQKPDLLENGMRPEALHRLGLKNRQKGQPGYAIDLISQAIQLSPDEPEYYKDLGNSYKDCGKHNQAIECYCKAIELNREYAQAHYDLGSIFFQTDRVDDALTALRKAIQLKPDYPQAYNNLALVLGATGRPEQALACLRKALEYDADLPEVWNNIGNIYKKRRDYPTARSHYEQALKIAPDMVEALNNLGQIHQGLRNSDEAIHCFTTALKANPSFVDSYINLGNTYQYIEKLRKAKSVYRQVLNFQPDHPVAHFNLGVVAHEMGDLDEAVSCCQKALDAQPNYEKACAYLLNLLLQQCSWNEIGTLDEKLDQMTMNTLKTGNKPAETPFLNLVRRSDPAMNLAVARAWSHEFSQMAANKTLTHHRPAKHPDRKLRIGYLSNNFRNHPTADLVSGILKHHNRNQFHITCYHYGINDGSLQRQRVEKACDRFVDLYHVNDQAAAQVIHNDRVDILVDLVGHTKGTRMGICAYRPAPIQMRYLGFAGSTGADFFDYIITDKIATPPQQARYYTEQFILMPDSYHVNNYKSDYGHAVPKPGQGDGSTRKDFIFCCFNASYKIDPDTFASWIEILKYTPNSILWLLADKEITRANFKQCAEKYGIDPNRLTFFNKAQKAEHFVRLGNADLALDTFAVSGAATTADALWAGLPVLTVAGKHFASCMSDSILSAAGLSELVFDNRNAYVRKAVELSNNRIQLRSIQEKVKQARQSSPLFDPRRFTQHLEGAFRESRNIYLNNQPPDMIQLY